MGTPADEDGSADLQYVLEVAEKISQNMQDYKVIVNKSTVPVGTANQTKAAISQLLKQRGANIRLTLYQTLSFERKEQL